MHALEASAGVDDTDPDHIRIMPRVPDPLAGIEVSNHLLLLPEESGFKKAKLNYSYEKGASFAFTCTENIPMLSIRLGPWSDSNSARESLALISKEGHSCRLESAGVYREETAWWIWIEELNNIATLTINPLTH